MPCENYMPSVTRGLLRRPPGLRLGCALLLSLVSATIIYESIAHSGVLNNQYDDAYITYRYAIHWARGEGLVFNVGERTDAASSFSFTVILAFLYRIGLHDVAAVSTVIGIASTGLTAGIVFYASAGLARTWLAPAAMALLVGYHGFLSGWAASGMETPFYTLAVTALIARLFFERKTDGWTASLACLVALTRVEGVLLVGVWLLTLVLDSADDRRRRRLLVQGGLVLGAIAALYVFKYAYYGTLLPHSFLFKRFASGYRPQPSAVLAEWRENASFFLLSGASGLVVMRRRSFAVWLAAFVLVSIVAILLGPWADHARYSVHLLPTIAMLGALTLDSLLLGLWPLALGLTFLIYGEAAESHRKMRGYEQWYSGHQVCRRQVGQYIARNLSKGAEVLSSDIGDIAYEAIDLSFIDMFSLTSADVLDAYVDGQNADAILEKRHPVFVADTYNAQGFQALRFLSGGVTIRGLAPSKLLGRVQVSAAAISCTSRDGLAFGAAPINVP